MLEKEYRMDDELRVVVRYLNQYRETWDDSKRLRALLCDCIPENKALRNTLITLYDEGIIESFSKCDDIRKQKYRYMKILTNSYAISENVAVIAIEAWYRVLISSNDSYLDLDNNSDDHPNLGDYENNISSVPDIYSRPHSKDLKNLLHKFTRDSYRFSFDDWKPHKANTVHEIEQELSTFNFTETSIVDVFILSPAINFLKKNIEANNKYLVDRTIVVDTPLVFYTDNDDQAEIFLTDQDGFQISNLDIGVSLAELCVDRNVLRVSDIFREVMDIPITRVDIVASGQKLNGIIFWTDINKGLLLEKGDKTNSLTLINDKMVTQTISMEELLPQLRNIEDTHYKGSGTFWFGPKGEEMCIDIYVRFITTSSRENSLFVRISDAIFINLLFYAVKRVNLDPYYTIETTFAYHEWLQLIELGQKMLNAQDYDDMYWICFDLAVDNENRNYESYMSRYGKLIWIMRYEYIEDMAALLDWTTTYVEKGGDVIVGQNL